MIELTSDELSVRLDPAHGAEILTLTELRSGRQLLGRPPREPESQLGGELDEERWTSRYRGGWQIAVPNAGNACMVGGSHHGFHGRGSVDPWELLEHDSTRAILRWRGHGLELTRTVTVKAGTVTVDLSWTATDSRAPLITVEHLCFGSELLDPEVEILADAVARELSEQDGPARGSSARWPCSRLLSGEIENAGRWPLSRERSRFTVLTDFAHGHAVVRNPHSRLEVQIDWDLAKLPAAWLWHEVRATGGIWDGRAELLAFEPASVPHSLGLAEALAREQALWAAPGRRDGYELTLTVASP